MSEDRFLIRNCRFALRCHQRWDTLEEADDPRTRYCHECSREVLLCHTEDQLRIALQANHCVAIPDTRSPALHAIGLVVPPSSWTK